MPFHYKAFVLVMTVTALMFVLAKPVFTRLIAEEDFNRRRNVWIVITVAAFLVPNFWVFVAIAAVAMIYGASKDPNPIALYAFLLLVIPPTKVPIPGFGIVNYVFPLDHLRLLSLVVLIPAMQRGSAMAAGPADAGLSGNGKQALRSADVLIVLYVLTQLALNLPYQSVTSMIRNLVLLCLDTLIPYYVISRSCTSRARIIDVMASFALALVVLAPLGIIEAVRGWILYAGLQDQWGSARMISYLTRGDYLRAQATGGHALVFGFALSVAFGFWLYLQSRLDARMLRWLPLAALLAGLYATLARGSWVGAVVILVVFLALGPGAFKRASKAMAAVLLIGGIVMATPVGDTIMQYLPFLGEGDEGSVTYRQRLAEMSWMLIQQNPLFGTPYYMAYMEELRQGEGIIDIVNTYAGIALSYGLVGAGLFVSFYLVILLQTWRTVRRSAEVDPDLSLVGSSLVACLAGCLTMIATVSNYLSIPYVLTMLAALMVAYVRYGMQDAPAIDASPAVASGSYPRQAWSR